MAARRRQGRGPPLRPASWAVCPVPGECSGLQGLGLPLEGTLPCSQEPIPPWSWLPGLCLWPEAWRHMLLGLEWGFLGLKVAP